METAFIEQCTAVLSRTPATLDAMLRGLPDEWTRATEGAGTWSPYDVIGHLNHGELTDWIPRLKHIVQLGQSSPFNPVDREAQFKKTQPATLSDMLDEFGILRRGSLAYFRELDLQPKDLERKGEHPTLGTVTLRQLLATWTAHDLAHILQISRVMARRYKQDVGPWAEFLSVMK